jgi:hypothetical protein
MHAAMVPTTLAVLPQPALLVQQHRPDQRFVRPPSSRRIEPPELQVQQLPVLLWLLAGDDQQGRTAGQLEPMELARWQALVHWLTLEPAGAARLVWSQKLLAAAQLADSTTVLWVAQPALAVACRVAAAPRLAE